MASKQACAKYQYVVTSSGPKILPVDEPYCKDEESPADYNAGGYLPVKLNDTFKNGRYRVVRKLGWGHFSTVWLVKDNELNRHSALKVVKSAGRYAETARDEIKLLSHVASFSPSHPGRQHIVSFLDSFSHSGPESSHICIVFEPLGENLLAVLERNRKKGVPRALVKVIAKQVLLGLQYLHDECDLVHTDIKPENILISIPDIEAHIFNELSRCPSPTSRRVGVPLPTKSRSGVTIPLNQRGSRRQVQIFDSQPLSSPGRSAGVPANGSHSMSFGASMGHPGSGSGSVTNSSSSSYISQNITRVSNHSNSIKNAGTGGAKMSTSAPKVPSGLSISSPPVQPLATSKLAPNVNPMPNIKSVSLNSPSTSSSSSSIASTSAGAGTSSNFSTPPTSLSHSLGNVILAIPNQIGGYMAVGGLDRDKQASDHFMKAQKGKGKAAGIPPRDDSGPSTSWKDRIPSLLLSSSYKSSFTNNHSKAAAHGHSRSQSGISLSSSWKDPGLSAPAPAVIIPAVVRADGEEEGDYFQLTGEGVSVASSSSTTVADITTSKSESSSTTVTIVRPSPSETVRSKISSQTEDSSTIDACSHSINSTGAKVGKDSFQNSQQLRADPKLVNGNNPSLLSQTAPPRTHAATTASSQRAVLQRASPPHHISQLSAHLHHQPSPNHRASPSNTLVSTAPNDTDTAIKTTANNASRKITPPKIAIPDTVSIDSPVAPPPSPNLVSPFSPPSDATNDPPQKTTLSNTDQHLSSSAVPASSTQPVDVPIPPDSISRVPLLPSVSIKIADLGNATPSRKHYTEDIQTRQYRAPEAIIGRKDWDTRADIWSVACVIFELLAGEFLFDPQAQGGLFTKDDDHMAQIIELLGDFALEAKMGGKFSRDLFDHTGALRYIRTLKFWPLRRVMVEKYSYSESDSDSLCDFLLPMLNPEMKKRSHARDMVDHEWLTITAVDDMVEEW